MSQWTLAPCHCERDCGFVIRGEDGRVVAHVQYEADAQTIMAAIRQFASANQPKPSEGKEA